MSEEEEPQGGPEAAAHDDSSDEEAAEDLKDDFALTGLREKGQYVWIDLEGDVTMAIYKPPIALAFCEEDETNNQVVVSWFQAFKWRGKLSAKNSTYAKFWNGDAKSGYTRLKDTIEVGSIVPVRVELAYERGEQVRITPNAVQALLDWCSKRPAPKPAAKPKQRKK